MSLLGPGFTQSTYEDWLIAVEQALKGAKPDSLKSEEPGGLKREPLYFEDPSQPSQSGLPGEAPFTRGASKTPDPHRPWHIAQRVQIGRKGSDNNSIINDLRGGVSALLLDLSNDIPDATTLTKLLDGVMLDIAPISLIPGANISASMEALDAVFTNQSISHDRQFGFLNADPIGTSVRADKPCNMDALASTLADVFRWGQDRPNMSLVTASSIAIHEAGASPELELASIIASLVEMMRACEISNIDLQLLVKNTTITLSADVDFFATIAKIRAMRLLWSQLLQHCHLTPEAPKLHMETSERCFSNVDPWVNILRASISAMAAGIGGVDVLTVAPCTATSEGDNDLTRRIARNTQIIMQEESHIGTTLDPAGGSWFVETATRELAEQAWAVFQDIEARGGLLAALQDGTIQRQIQTTNEIMRNRYADRDRAMIGVTEFPNLDEAPLTPRPSRGSGDYQEIRPAATFEALRSAAEPTKPKVYLANIGATSNFTARANFAANLYAIGGIHSVSGSGGDSVETILDEFKKSGAKIACVCAAEKDYDSLAQPLVDALVHAGAIHVSLAGKPKDITGVDDYAFAGCDALTFAEKIHKTLGLGV
jgi:methylmalonyl-CoA mutase